LRKLLQYTRQLRQRRQSAFSLKQAPFAQIHIAPRLDADTTLFASQALDVSALRRRLAESEYTDSPHHD